MEVTSEPSLAFVRFNQPSDVYEMLTGIQKPPPYPSRCGIFGQVKGLEQVRVIFSRTYGRWNYLSSLWSTVSGVFAAFCPPCPQVTENTRRTILIPWLYHCSGYS